MATRSKASLCHVRRRGVHGQIDLPLVSGNIVLKLDGENVVGKNACVHFEQDKEPVIRLRPLAVKSRQYREEVPVKDITAIISFP